MGFNLDQSMADMDRIGMMVQNADNKANLILAIGSGLLGLFAGNMIEFLKSLKSSPITAGRAILLIFMLLFLGSLILTIYTVFRVILPRVKKKEHSTLFHFSNIADLPKEEFSEKMRNLTEEEVLHNAIYQLYENAQIAKIKYYDVLKAWQYLYFGVIFGFLFNFLVEFI
ncbi:hypothetical protein A2Y83_02700 [Candidatus Falkowbacteria bacterium RBG_13_39_14]|uniref:Pycsar effector protein domain-containing protein n=1 Tax=Candidatus Falkowbacteria bacterium RBG_13_39_14 TaxID=1797985 RepID=A0A1F5S3B2_9BACT|nr:MAG: hypothetical protein A2Y83_02700 [Candidatus Falkowbacteria bacterium RBG_13_39_14]